MENLIKLWERRSEKYRQLAVENTNDLIIQGLLANSEAYGVCVSELKRAIASQSNSAGDALIDTRLKAIEKVTEMYRAQLAELVRP